MYKSRDGMGELITGIVQAATADDAARSLRSEGKFIVSLEPVNDADLDSSAVTQRSTGRGIKRDQIINFAHQLAIMLETGVPLGEAMDCIVEQTDHEAFRAVLEDVSQQVQAGGDLSAALRAYPRVFPPIMTSLVRASEISGTMGTMLDRVSRYLAKERATAKKIRGALAYPAVMLMLVIAVTVFLLVFVLPQFAGIYDARETALPAPTRLLMALSDALTGYWYVWVAAVGVVLLMTVVTLRTPTGQRLLDYAKLNLPIIGKLFAKLYITRGCRTMGTLINAGVPILDMVNIVRQVTHNVFYEDLWDEVDERLRQGSQLSEALFTSPLIPRSVAQMIHSGEKAGRLGPVVERIAEHTEEEFDEQVKQTTQFIEPALVAIMGAVIGFVAIALLLPIFSVGQVVA
ncbi:MAG: type II secretion system F family protein, partial [Phycisphaeraceae bacterium]